MGATPVSEREAFTATYRAHYGAVLRYLRRTRADLWAAWERDRAGRSTALDHGHKACRPWFDAGTDPLRVRLEDDFVAAHRAELDEHVRRLAANAAFVAAHQE